MQELGRLQRTSTKLKRCAQCPRLEVLARGCVDIASHELWFVEAGSSPSISDHSEMAGQCISVWSGPPDRSASVVKAAQPALIARRRTVKMLPQSQLGHDYFRFEISE